MLRRTLRFLCSDATANARTLLRKCETLEQEISVANEKLTSLRNEVSSFVNLGQNWRIKTQHKKQTDSLT